VKSYWMRNDAQTSVVELREVPQPEPGAGQVLIRVRSSGLNRGEFIPGHGLHGSSAEFKPVGNEAAGEVVKLGPGVTEVKVGDRVMGRSNGAFAEYALMDSREALRVPDNVSWEEAAAIPLAFMVVYDMLVMQGRMVAGEWLLVNGVSSGVGVAALQMAKAMGIKVVGTSGSAEKLERLRDLGLDAGICTRGADFGDEVLRVTEGHGADLAVNAVGGSVFNEAMRCLAYQGRLATVGYVDGVLKAELDIDDLHSRRLVVFGVSNKRRTFEQRAPMIQGFVRDILPMFADGRIRPFVDKVYPFAEFPQAKDYMEANRHLGKIVVTIPG